MDPFVAIVVLIALVFTGYVVKKGTDLEKMKLQDKHGSSDKSLGVSELQGLIRQAVEEASVPLHRRILELEARLDEHDDSRELAGPHTRELKAARAEGER